MLLADTITRQLMAGGYREMRSGNIPCRIFVKKSSDLTAVCLFETLKGKEGRTISPEAVRSAVENALQKQSGLECSVLSLIISENIAEDSFAAKEKGPVWLIDLSGKRIVFDNQPDHFHGVEALLEKKITPFNGILSVFKGSVPWVTLSLAAVNLLIQIIVAFQERNGSFSALSNAMVLNIGDFLENHEYYRLFTSAFLHFGWQHLFNNMLVLIFLGKVLEQAAGKWRYLASYLICAVGSGAASVVWYAVNGKLSVSTAGASGAIFGIAGMLLVYIIKHRNKSMEIQPRQIFLMMLFTVYHGVTESGVNNCAHIAGAAIGMIFGFFL